MRSENKKGKRKIGLGQTTIATLTIQPFLEDEPFLDDHSF